MFSYILSKENNELKEFEKLGQDDDNKLFDSCDFHNDNLKADISKNVKETITEKMEDLIKK